MSKLTRAAVLAALGMAGPFGCVADVLPEREAASQAMVASNSPVGTWYLDANHYRIEIDIEIDVRTPGGLLFTGWLVNEYGRTETLDHITFDPSSGVMEFRRNGIAFWQWYRMTITEGVLVGRFVHQYVPDKPDITAYDSHVTGWNAAVIDARGIYPRAWDVDLAFNLHAKIRVDRAPSGALLGRFKVYASTSTTDAEGNVTRLGSQDEELEFDVDVLRWDGRTLVFLRRGQGWTQTFTATAQGRTLTGSYTAGDGYTFEMSGVRADVLGFGLAARSSAGRTAWQDRARKQIARLIMQGNPVPVSISPDHYTAMNAVDAPIPFDRDDAAADHPQAYNFAEVSFDYAIPNPYLPGATMPRHTHGYLAIPGKCLRVRCPAVLALNGHGGNAYATFTPNDGNSYFYGDAFARRGYIVLAIDVGHRPVQDRPFVYPGSDADDPNHGSLKALAGTSDWEEDGERAWDAMRGIDYLASRFYVDPSRIAVTGHSMGGEVASYVGALDPRVRMVIPSGYSPDLDVMFWNDNHRCWPWWNADIREYIDVGDLQALVAPRPIAVESGIKDPFFSPKHHVAVVKQVWRRSREGAYAGVQWNFLALIHDDEHRYRYGEAAPEGFNPLHVGAPKALAPSSPESQAWQQDTSRTYMPLFNFVTTRL
jgi:hypothetical protein